MSGGRNTLVRDALVGAMILAAVLLLGYMATRLGSVAGGGGRTLVMVFEDATGLIETAPVSVAGVKVGSVRSIEYSERGAKVTAAVREDVAIHADARAAVKAKSLLGEKFVALMPGTPAAGPFTGDEVQTLPAADIDRMAAAIARLAEHVDPQDVKQVVHGLAVALGEDGDGTSIPESIRDVGRDLHRLAASLEGATGSAKDVAAQLGPVLKKIDALATRTDATLEKLDPAIEDLPETVAAFERAARRVDSLLARVEKVDTDRLRFEIRQILQEEGVYVRLRSRNVKEPKSGQDDEEPDEAAGNPFEPRRHTPVPQ